MICDIVVFDGVDELDALGPLEVLRRVPVGWQTRLVTQRPQRMVTGSVGLQFVPDGVWEPGRSDILIIPGGGWAARAATGAWAEHLRGDLIEPIRTARGHTPLIAGVCTGTMLLAHAGVITGRRAATHHTAREELSQLGVAVVDARVVDDGDLVTCGGVTSGIDLALWLVEREVGATEADRIGEVLEYPRFRPDA